MFEFNLDRFFCSVKKIPAMEEKVQELTKSLISSYSNGNVSIQKGNYLTQEDIKYKEKLTKLISTFKEAEKQLKHSEHKINNLSSLKLRIVNG